MFGVYDYTNDQMWAHGYREGKQFLDYIKRDGPKVYGGIKQMFLVLDNILIHKSNKVKAALSNHHPMIHLVFLPTTRSPELDLIEVKGGCGCNDKPLKTPPFKMNGIQAKRHLNGHATIVKNIVAKRV